MELKPIISGIQLMYSMKDGAECASEETFIGSYCSILHG